MAGSLRKERLLRRSRYAQQFKPTPQQQSIELSASCASRADPMRRGRSQGVRKFGRDPY
jgi:hypothetical protein